MTQQHDPLAFLDKPEVVLEIEIAVAERYVLIPQGAPWEDVSEYLTKAAIDAIKRLAKEQQL